MQVSLSLCLALAVKSTTLIVAVERKMGSRGLALLPDRQCKAKSRAILVAGEGLWPMTPIPPIPPKTTPGSPLYPKKSLRVVSAGKRHSNMAPLSKRLTGDQTAINEFIDKFDVR